jgi:hypothetical protein
MNPEELPIFSKYSSLILIIDASVVGLFIGFNAKIPTIEGMVLLIIFMIFLSELYKKFNIML